MCRSFPSTKPNLTIDNSRGRRASCVLYSAWSKNAIVDVPVTVPRFSSPALAEYFATTTTVLDAEAKRRSNRRFSISLTAPHSRTSSLPRTITTPTSCESKLDASELKSCKIGASVISASTSKNNRCIFVASDSVDRWLLLLAVSVYLLTCLGILYFGFDK